MSRVFRHMTTLMKVGFAVACLALIVLWPEWRVSLQQVCYSYEGLECGQAPTSGGGLVEPNDNDCRTGERCSATRVCIEGDPQSCSCGAVCVPRAPMGGIGAGITETDTTVTVDNGTTVTVSPDTGITATVPPGTDTPVTIDTGTGTTVTVSPGAGTPVTVSPGTCTGISPPNVRTLGGTTADQNSSSDQEGQTSGDPINNTTGNLFQIETDYVGAGGAFPLVLRRVYNSQSFILGGSFGVHSSHSYDARIIQTSPTSVLVIRADQKTLTFTLQNGLWRSTPDINATLEPLTAASGEITGWRYTTGADHVEFYDAIGRLRSITTRAGLTQSLSYDGARLASVKDPFDRTLTFAYDTRNRVHSVTDPAGRTYSYTYDANNRLSSVTGPDNQTREYRYEDARFPRALTGLIDENQNRFAT